ncbi:MAG: protein translocase subunit SecD [Deltaproteobacteria bacterium]|nr:MAG: protein translocase subunit SecD [Deltaproteobacteria bacterium]
MEGNYLFRLGAIVALFLGAVYVLLPTFLQADVEAQLAQTAAGVETPVADVAADEVLYKTADPAAAAEAISARLDHAGVAVDGVAVKGADVLVKVAPGTSRDDVDAALALAPVKAYRLMDQLTEVPEAIDGTALIGTLRGQAPKAAAMGSVSDVNGAPALVGASFGETEPRWVALADSEIVALAEVAEDGSLTVVGYTGAPGRLLIAPLGVEVERYADKATVEAAEEVAEVQSNVPAWLEGILSDKKLNLGLDLQGGIDLTLQVELEEAVLAKVSRDLAYFKQMAEEEGVAVESARPHPILPQIEVTTPAPLADVQAFFAARMFDYIYVQTDGTTHTFGMKEEVQDEVGKQAVEQVLETLRNRVDATGVKEPSIVKKGGGRINVQLPGAVDAGAAVDALGTTAILEFRMVDEEFDQIRLGEIIADAEGELPPEQFQDDDVLNRYFWRTGKLADDRWVLWEYSEVAGEGGKAEKVRDRAIVVKDVSLTGAEVNDASVGFDPNTQMPDVILEFKPRGSTVFCTLTGENVGKRFAIVLDNQVRSAPEIRDKICGGRASISMGGSLDALQDANTLALVLRTGSLTAPVSVGQVRQVGPTLGADAINAGIYGTGIGAFFVLLFMLVWYRIPGLLANVALFLNVFLVFAFLTQFEATLTLPGIAGVALTVGMAVDANIIIYERIQEELRLGVHARKAVDAGFDKALWAVLDANITTAIAGVVLYSYGSGPIKGFAVTLLIGIITTLITALFVNRTFLELATRRSSATLRF